MTIVALGLWIASLQSDIVAAARDPFEVDSAMVAACQAKVVKIIGAAVGSQKGYATGVLCSGDGQIVTALSPLLEASAVSVTLADGRRFDARVLRRDERRQLALLKIDVRELLFFDLNDRAAEPEVGAPVLAVANPFKVAGGNEPVSISWGLFSGRARLQARFRSRDVAYRGEVLLTDVVVSAPGSAGGALVDLNGRLLGVIGRPVVSNWTNTWLNYAMPAAEVAAFVAGDSESGTTEGESATRGADADARLLRLGIRLFDVGGAERPAYVERVRTGSQMERAGLRSDDLILSVNGVTVSSVADVLEQLGSLGAGPIELVVKRGERIEVLIVAVETNA